MNFSFQLAVPCNFKFLFISLKNSFFLFFFLIKDAPGAYGNSQTKGQIGAAVASLCHSHSNARFKLHLQPTP